jgi:hypothetical protein
VISESQVNGAAYARMSTDMQNEKSSEDQVRVCRERARTDGVVELLTRQIARTNAEVNEERRQPCDRPTLETAATREWRARAAAQWWLPFTPGRPGRDCCGSSRATRCNVA